MQVQGAVAGAAGGARGAGAASLARYRGVFDGIGKILAREGPAGLYRGSARWSPPPPSPPRQYFGGYETAKRLVPESALGPSAAYLVSGMLAQSFAGVVYTPMDVVKERLQRARRPRRARRRRLPRLPTAYRNHPLAREGPRGLFRGYWASNFTWWPWSAVYFLAYEHGRDATARVLDVTDKEALPPWVSSACATAAAAAATAATHPLDLAEDEMDPSGRPEGAESSAPGSAPGYPRARGVFGVMRDVARREGVAALTAGAGARVLAVAPGSAVSFFVYETIKGWLGTED